MGDLQTMTPDVTPGQDATPASPQDSDSGTQVPGQSQDVTSTQVEPGELRQSSQEDPRRASDFETARQIKRLAKQMQSIQQALERSSQQNVPQGFPQAQPLALPTNDEVVKDPIGAINRLMDIRLNALKGEIPQQLQQAVQVQRQEHARQEALRLIKTNSLIKADPEGEEKMREILLDEDEEGNSLQQYSLTNPRHAAQLALKEYQSRYGGNGIRSASPPSKAQMTTTATAVKSAAANNSTEQEAAQLYRMVLADPNLMNDPAYTAKLDAFNKKSRMEKLLQG